MKNGWLTSEKQRFDRHWNDLLAKASVLMVHTIINSKMSCGQIHSLKLKKVCSCYFALEKIETNQNGHDEQQFHASSITKITKQMQTSDSFCL